MLEQQVPEAGVLVGEGQVDLRQAADPAGGVAVLQEGRQALVERLEHAGLHVQHHIVEVLEHIVDGARRILDAAGNLTCGQAGQSLNLDNVLCRIENELAQLLRRVRRPASHGHPG